MDATRDQWQAQGILQQEPRSEARLRMLQGIWPDVAPGSQLAFVVRGGEAVLVPRQRHTDRLYPARPAPVGGVQHPLAIWLDPRTTYPELRQQLIGGTP